MTDTVTRLCETCNASLTQKQIIRGNRFCSPACNGKRFLNQIQQSCVICNKTFSRQAAKISPYCSKECSRIGRHKGIVTSFWEKVDQSGECWLWTGAKGKFGHGLFTMGHKGRTTGAHRFAYELTYGPISKSIVVCHSCDIPACVRPEHLFLGTRADNNHDRNIKDRQANGQAIWQAKLTENDIRVIRSSTIARGKLKAFAAHYGVRPETITRIRQRKLWKHID